MKLLRNSLLYVDAPASEELLRYDGNLSEDWVVPDRQHVNRKTSSLGTTAQIKITGFREHREVYSIEFCALTIVSQHVNFKLPANQGKRE